MKQLVKRKDNITYTREVKEPNNYKEKLSFRVDKETFDIFRNVAKQKGVAYSELLRNFMKEENEKWVNGRR